MSISTQQKKQDQLIRPKILYIENHSALRTILTQSLTLVRNYEVAVASNGLEGLEKARSWQPDLILMGLRMPVMDGFETIRRLRHNPETADIPIIVISAWASAIHKARALAAGANEHLSSPVELPRLLHKIDKYLKQRSQH